MDRALSQTTHLRRSLFQLYHLLETISPLFFIPLVPYPPLRGTFPSRGRLCSSIAVLSYRSLPHWGRGTASAVDRVLSLIAALRRISSLFFIPPSPSNLRPFGAPPSIGRRECPRKPFPWKGLPSAARRGWLPFLGRRSRLLFAFPTRGRGTASAVDRVLSYIVDLRRFLFHLYHLLEAILLFTR